MKKIFIVLHVCSILFTSSVYAQSETTSAENLVKNFYRWYILQNEKNISQYAPRNDDAIYSYVDHCVVHNIRIFYERAYFDADYFTKSQDLWKEWLDDLTVYPAVKIDNTTSIVPISFEFNKDDFLNLVVFVKNEKNKLRITKIVEDSIRSDY